jgi:hypothetical protein
MILAWLASLLISVTAFAGNVNSFSYSSTNVTTSAYVTLVSSTPIPTTQIIVCDNSGHILKIASGAPGSEVDLFTVALSACIDIQLGAAIPASTRLSIRAIDATASSGFNTVSFIP